MRWSNLTIPQQYTNSTLAEGNAMLGLYNNGVMSSQGRTNMLGIMNDSGYYLGNRIPNYSGQIGVGNYLAHNPVPIAPVNTGLISSPVTTPAPTPTTTSVIKTTPKIDYGEPTSIFRQNNDGYFKGFSFINDGNGFGSTVSLTDEYKNNPYALSQLGLVNKGMLSEDEARNNIIAYGKANELEKKAMMHNSGTMHTAIAESMPTALDWGKFGLNTLNSLYGMYMGNKNLKLQKQNFEEQKALNRANFKMQAKSYNNSLRNQMSGRSFTGMSGTAQRMLGRDYNARKAEETY